MTDLFNAPVLRYDEPDGEGNYRITDAEGQVLATGSRVMGDKEKGWLKSVMSSGEELRGRAVVRIDAPDGTPLFFVDRTADEPGGAARVAGPSITVVAPDGTLIGRVETNLQLLAETAAEGMPSFPGMGHSYTAGSRVFDASGQHIMNVVWEEVQIDYHHNWSSDGTEMRTGGRFCVISDTKGVDLARMDDNSNNRKDKYELTLNFQLPEPLRTLAIATPVVIDLGAAH